MVDCFNHFSHLRLFCKLWPNPKRLNNFLMNMISIFSNPKPNYINGHLVSPWIHILCCYLFHVFMQFPVGLPLSPSWRLILIFLRKFGKMPFPFFALSAGISLILPFARGFSFGFISICQNGKRKAGKGAFLTNLLDFYFWRLWMENIIWRRAMDRGTETKARNKKKNRPRARKIRRRITLSENWEANWLFSEALFEFFRKNNPPDELSALLKSTPFNRIKQWNPFCPFFSKSKSIKIGKAWTGLCFLNR